MAAVFKVGYKADIVESNRIVRECTVKCVAGNLIIIIRFENSGGIQISRNRLFDTKEAAKESVQEMKSTVQNIPKNLSIVTSEQSALQTVPA